MIAQPLLNQVLELPPEDRFELAGVLWDSVDMIAPTQMEETELDIMMGALADHRCALVDRGEMETVDGAEVMARLKQKYAP